MPKPEVSRSALVPFGDLQTGISSVLKIIKANANPTAIEFIERSVVELGESFTGQKFPCPEAKAYILPVSYTHLGYITRKNALLTEPGQRYVEEIQRYLHAHAERTE